MFIGTWEIPSAPVYGRRSRPTEDNPMADGKSDHLIVLGDGRAVHMGKRVEKLRNLQRKHDAKQMGCYTHANHIAGNIK